MHKFFTGIYDFFVSRKWLLYGVLCVIIAILAVLALQIRLNENITSFFSDDEQSSSVLENLKMTDKIVILVKGDDPDIIAAAGEAFADSLETLVESGQIATIARGADQSIINSSTDFIYDYLPIFLEEDDYSRIDSLLTSGGIDTAVKSTYDLLVSPSGLMIKDVILRDPISVGTHLMKRFERFSADYSYELYSGHIFTKDLSMMMMYVEPVEGMGNTGSNDAMISYMEAKAEEISEDTGTEIVCIGGPVIAVHNARQIKKDTAVTMTCAMVLILLLIILSFRKKRTLLLIALPPFFGALFALALIFVIKGSISAIAIGAGAVVLGVALSYSIHVIAHSNHTNDPRKIIEELAYPLTVGSITTIGAFAALMFTNSPLLKDMGLFAVLALIGTCLFCLIFLPHFIGSGSSDTEKPLLKWIEKANNVEYENKKWLLGVIAVATVVGLFLYGKVSFDSNLNSINYMPEHISQAEKDIAESFGDTSSGIFIASVDDGSSDSPYRKLDSLLAGLAAGRQIEAYTSVSDFVISKDVQSRKIDRWNEFWKERKDATLGDIERAAIRYGFNPKAFDKFRNLLDKEYVPCDYSSDVISKVSALSDWINPVGDGKAIVLSQIRLDKLQKEAVYPLIEKAGDNSIIDSGYYSSKMVNDTSEDFDFILLVSSLIVFIALLISYGRLELALLAFLPMVICWVIILALMALLDIRFNIVNVILATFIFGIGDDFSIFIMDGLMYEYRTGKKMLGAHKTAIFFSAFTTIVGMGAMIFAGHPALKSVAVISVLGIAVVILVSYTVQPFLFKVFISSKRQPKVYPYTIGGILNTLYTYLYFITGAIGGLILRISLYLVPISSRRKKEILRWFLHIISKIYLITMATVDTKWEKPEGEDFRKPAIIISNHQSWCDLLIMLAINPKLIIITKDNVWNAPVIGWIVRFADYYHIGQGYEYVLDKLREKVEEGNSILIFPEGTRSPDCKVGRFHKGAFYLAEELKIDILPAVIYGAGHVCSKPQPTQINVGNIVCRFLERVPYDDTRFGSTYQEKTKAFRKYITDEFLKLNDEYGRFSDPYYRHAPIKKFLYMGKDIKKAIRSRQRDKGYFDTYDRLIPRDAGISDVCGNEGYLSLTLSLMSPYRRLGGNDVYIANGDFTRGNLSEWLKTISPEGMILIQGDEIKGEEIKRNTTDMNINIEAVKWNQKASMRIYKLTQIHTDNEG